MMAWRLTLAGFRADNDGVKWKQSIPAGAALSVMTLAVLMSMAGGSASVSMGAVLYSANQHASLRSLTEEETQHWIGRLAEAARSLHGKPGLPEHLVAAITQAGPGHAFCHAPSSSIHPSPRAVLPACDHLTLDLIDLPPPVMG